MKEIKISYEARCGKSHPLRSIAESLNCIISCDTDRKFFRADPDHDNRILFSACANTQKHNKLVALITLWFCNTHHGYTGFYNPPYFCINDCIVEEFGDFIDSLPKIEDVKIQMN